MRDKDDDFLIRIHNLKIPMGLPSFLNPSLPGCIKFDSDSWFEEEAANKPFYNEIKFNLFPDGF